MRNVTWDPINKSVGATLSNNDLTVSLRDYKSTARASRGKKSGKWYWEITVNSITSRGSILIGISNESASLTAYNFDSQHVRYYFSHNGYKYPEAASYGALFGAGHVIGVALDLVQGTLEFYKNGISQGVSHTNIDSMGTVYPTISAGSSTAGGISTANFGSSPFVYPIPEGYVAYESNIHKYLLQDGEEIKTMSLQESWDHEWNGFVEPSEAGWDIGGNGYQDVNISIEEDGSLKMMDTSETTARSYSMILDSELVQAEEDATMEVEVKVVSGDEVGFINVQHIELKKIIAIQFGPTGIFNNQGALLYSVDLTSFQKIKVHVYNRYNNFDIYVNGMWCLSGEATSYTSQIGSTRFNFGAAFNKTGVVHYKSAKLKIGTMEESYRLETIGTAPVTKEMFDTHGMTDLSLLDNEAIASLSSDTPELLCWTDEEGIEDSYSQDVVPAMSGASGNGVSISWSSVNGNDVSAYGWKAFNNNPGDIWYTAAGSQWLKIEFAEPKTIQKYTLQSASGSANNMIYAPMTWRLEGSETGAFKGEEVTLHQPPDQKNWTPSEIREFTLANDTPFLFYRLYIVKNNNNGSWATQIAEIELMEKLPEKPVSRTAHLTAIPHPQLLLPVEDIEVGEIESVKVETTALESIKLLVSGDSGVTWKGKTVVDPADLESVKANGFPVVEFNALTKEELADLFPNGKARFAFYLEQESSADTVELHSLTINERQYTMTPSLENLSVIYELLESESPSLHVSRDDGATWKEVRVDELTTLDDLPEGKALRVKAVLRDGQELHGLSYSWI